MPEIIYLWAYKIVYVRLQYLKPFKWVQTND